MPRSCQLRAVARLFGLLLAALVFAAQTAQADPSAQSARTAQPAQAGESASPASPLRVTLLGSAARRSGQGGA